MACMNLAALTQDQQKTVFLQKGHSLLSCYRLRTHREYLVGSEWKPQNGSTLLSDAKIRRWRFGEINPISINKTMLIVGETGTGKTTLINTIVNRMLKVKFEDKVWFEITEEEDRSQVESQTTAITVYEVYIDGNPNSLTIIDTPGYGDTRGAEHDKAIPELMLTLFKSYDGVNRLDAVGLLMKASQNRLTPSQRYIFDAVLSVFGKDLEKNIVIFITHSDGMSATQALKAIDGAKTPCARDEDGDPVHYMLNNRQCEQYKEKEKRMYQAAWEMVQGSLEEFFVFLNKTEGKNLTMTEKVLKERKQLEAILINLQQCIIKEENIQTQLNQTEEALKANKDKLDNNENFEFEVDEMQKPLVLTAKAFKDTTERATRCTKCKQNCHFRGCTTAPANHLWMCEVMKINWKMEYLCLVCPLHCSYKDHVKDDKVHINVTQKVKRMSHDLKKQLEDEYGENVDLKAGIKQKLQDSIKEESRLVVEAYEIIMQLQEIALQKEAMSILVHLDLLIDKLKETGHPEKAKNLEEIKKRAPPVSTETNAFYKALLGIRKWLK